MERKGHRVWNFLYSPVSSQGEQLITSPRPCLLIADESLLVKKYHSLCHRVIILKIVTSDTTLKEFKCGVLVTDNTTIRIFNRPVVDCNYGLEEEEIKEQ